MSFPEHNVTTWSNIRAYSAVPQPTDSASAIKTDGYVLHPSTLNPNILKAQYAVRGELYNKAVELAAKGRDIIYTNGKCGRVGCGRHGCATSTIASDLSRPLIII